MREPARLGVVVPARKIFLDVEASCEINGSTFRVTLRRKAMEIVGYKFGHDGTVCCVHDGKLLYSIEGEKDSQPRHAPCSRAEFERILQRRATRPALICTDSERLGEEALHYLGIEPSCIRTERVRIAGRQVEVLSIPHEMCHIAGSFAMSDLAEGQEFYALLWEGYIGRLYHVDSEFRIHQLGAPGEHICEFVGARYTFPYFATHRGGFLDLTTAGKIMALAGRFPTMDRDSGTERWLSTLLDSEIRVEGSRISLDGDQRLLQTQFAGLRQKEIDSLEFCRACRWIQDGIFERFLAFARRHVRRTLPLVISGGCGLNCEWNTRWRESKLFQDVFVAPVTNDSGIAIGAAAVGQRHRTGMSKIRWNVYSGEDFLHDCEPDDLRDFARRRLNWNELVDGLLDHLWVIAWVQGRYEIGPRALCHRSLLAAPFQASTRDTLNRIKRRESFRPIAPVCLEEDVEKHYEWSGPSPHMLYFQRARSSTLQAVTHYDGTARVQTVNRFQNPRMHALLTAFKKRTGFGVLCNTSLNFPGRGFINRMSDLARYVRQTEVSAMVVGNEIFIKRQVANASTEGTSKWTASAAQRNLPHGRKRW